ncbi:ribonuclease H-like domain-containing protein [Tanacetum coccineum]|uniref:Ribonuclease H-like domain-containing protein n=1 Tax=Tanacetum coccineum TaxID=301880 RepID=A0ABQ5HIX3_9ASTR
MMERELGEGYSFIKKKCFVCGSLSHLIRDCDFYEKKMAREAELKKQRVFNTGNGVAKPVWNNANRVNRAHHFIPRPVQLNTVRQNVNFVRPNVNTGRANVNSVKSNVNSVRPNVNTGRANVNSVKSNVNFVRYNVNSVRTNVNTGRSKQPDHSTQEHGGRWYILIVDVRGPFSGNNDHLDDSEECKGGSVTFGGSKGYITGKGRIRVGN